MPKDIESEGSIAALDYIQRAARKALGQRLDRFRPQQPAPAEQQPDGGPTDEDLEALMEMTQE